MHFCVGIVAGWNTISNVKSCSFDLDLMLSCGWANSRSHKLSGGVECESERRGAIAEKETGRAEVVCSEVPKTVLSELSVPLQSWSDVYVWDVYAASQFAIG